MPKIKMPRGHAHQPMSRQHKRVLTYLLFGAIFFGAYYMWSARPIDTLAVPFPVHETYMNKVQGTKTLVSQQSYDWRTAPFIKKIKTYIPLPAGIPHDLPRVQFENFSETLKQKQTREARRVAVRNEFQRSWNSYRAHAWTKDELKPVTGESQDSFGGWGATLVDSLDTLWIMGFKEEFYEAVEAAAAIDFGKTDLNTVSVFETTIRYLGGFLSAYDLSQSPVLLEKAVQLGEMLYRAFDTENSTPVGWFDVEGAKLADREEFGAEFNLCFACLGSLTMEFTHLTQVTSQTKFYDAVARITVLLDQSQNSTRLPGLWPTMVDAATASFSHSSSFSIGALADSAYEYFPKMHALLGGLEPVYEKLYKDSAAMIDKHMLFRPMIPEPKVGEDLLFCGEVYANGPNNAVLNPAMQHLTCFIGGMFGLAGRLFKKQHDIDLGAKLTKGCVFAYESFPTGIMPETFDVMACESRTSCPWNETLWEDRVLGYSIGPQSTDRIKTFLETHVMPRGFTSIRDYRYLLRPEAIESVFIMYRITGEQIYQDYAWNMFTAIVTATATPYGNSEIKDVTFQDPSPPIRGQHRLSTANGGKLTRDDNLEDKMESFWTAETLKYFYLIFSPPDMISLDDWVFNTEAHPFKRPKARKSKVVGLK